MMDFNAIWGILEEAFPPDERRNREAQENLLKLEGYHIVPFYEEEILVGFLCFWDLQDFIFIEHLAVEKVYRGKGYGKRMMKDFLSSNKRIIILEVELPEDEISSRRIRFYENLGFKLNDLEYCQPSYGEGKEAIPLLLMSYPNLISDLNVKTIINQIHRDIYGVQVNVQTK